MYERATKHPAPTGILLSADAFWKTHKTHKYYGHSHTAPTPQISTLQNLGLGITKAFSLHIRNGILRSQTNLPFYSSATDTSCTTNNPSIYTT